MFLAANARMILIGTEGLSDGRFDQANFLSPAFKQAGAPLVLNCWNFSQPRAIPGVEPPLPTTFSGSSISRYIAGLNARPPLELYKAEYII